MTVSPQIVKIKGGGASLLSQYYLYTGNDCLFEGNRISKLCYETSDSGGFYTGRSWIDRGNIIMGNIFSDIYNTETTHLGSPSVQAIYLDDQVRL